MSRLYTIVLALRENPASNGDLPGHEFLMIRNAARGGKLELPGGRAEGDEAAEACARRELIEETGHDWLQPRLVQQRPGGGHVFLCRLGARVGDPEAAITEIRFVERLPPRAELSFPDDPYPEMFAAARALLATRPGAAARP